MASSPKIKQTPCATGPSKEESEMAKQLIYVCIAHLNGVYIAIYPKKTC
jgi:hypothetical protein